MATLSRDTSEQIERRILELLRKETPGARMRMAAQASEALWALAEGAVRRDYPHASEEEVRCRFAARWLGREWAIRLFGDGPELHGW